MPYNRNGVLFPRKIGGEYLMLSRPSDTGHTSFGDIFVSRSPDLKYWGCHRYVMGTVKGDESAWQSTKIGPGPTPIETDGGWLLIYHGVLTTCNGYVYRMEWTELGPVRATLELERRFSNSLIRQKIHFYAECPRIDFETWVDWKEHQHLLKVHFPVDVHSDEATFEIQFGNVTRKTHFNTSWDQARFESCGQKWIDVSEGHYGVSLLNDCKYGHSVHDGNLAVTLIKSGIEPNPTTDQEEHVFTYALYPHAETWRGAETVAQAYFLNQPACAVPGGEAGTEFSLASVDAKNVIVETIKQAEDGDGVIVRLYECENARTQAALTWNRPVASVRECNLLEEPQAELAARGNQIPFTILPYEIKTFRIQ